MNVFTTILVSLSGGSLIGSILTALVTFNLNRASAVKLISDAAKSIAEENKAMREDVVKLRDSIITLTDALDEVIPLLDVDVASKLRLREINRIAKLAV